MMRGTAARHQGLHFVIDDQENRGDKAFTLNSDDLSQGARFFTRKFSSMQHNWYVKGSFWRASPSGGGIEVVGDWEHFCETPALRLSSSSPVVNFVKIFPSDINFSSDSNAEAECGSTIPDFRSAPRDYSIWPPDIYCAGSGTASPRIGIEKTYPWTRSISAIEMADLVVYCAVSAGWFGRCWD